MSLVNDNFSSYTPGGPQLPTGFQNNGIVFTANIVVPSSPTPAPGFYEKTGNIYLLFGTIRYPTDINLATTVMTSASVWWSTLTTNNNNLNTGVVNIVATDINPPYTTTFGLITVIPEVDGSVSLVIPGVTKINTLVQVVFPFTWHFFQLGISVASINVSGTLFIAVTPYLAVNGVLYISGIQYTTNITVASCPIGANLDGWQMIGPPNGVYFSEIVIQAGLATIPSFPNGAATIHAFDSQVVLETMEQPTRFGRMSQIVNEVIEAPSSRNARMSQIVIEVIRKFKNGSGGWQIYEA